MKHIKEAWVNAAEANGLDPLEGLLVWIMWMACICTLIAVFALGMSWLWPVGFFLGSLVAAWKIGTKMEKREKDRV